MLSRHKIGTSLFPLPMLQPLSRNMLAHEESRLFLVALSIMVRRSTTQLRIVSSNSCVRIFLSSLLSSSLKTSCRILARGQSMNSMDSLKLASCLSLLMVASLPTRMSVLIIVIFILASLIIQLERLVRCHAIRFVMTRILLALADCTSVRSSISLNSGIPMVARRSS